MRMLLFLFFDIPTLYHSQLTAVKMRYLLSSIIGCNMGSGPQAIHHFRNEEAKPSGAVSGDRENKLVNSTSLETVLDVFAKADSAQVSFSFLERWIEVAHFGKFSADYCINFIELKDSSLSLFCVKWQKCNGISLLYYKVFICYM